MSQLLIPLIGWHGLLVLAEFAILSMSLIVHSSVYSVMCVKVSFSDCYLLSRVENERLIEILLPGFDQNFLTLVKTEIQREILHTKLIFTGCKHYFMTQINKYFLITANRRRSIQLHCVP